MKRLIFVCLFALSAWLASANSVHYFTSAQVQRVVTYLNTQDELMIYCGYADELETYVLLNEVWAERVNGTYFEVWVYGYDAYTGEEIFMPVDLDCIWLIRNSHIYNAAKYLRFRCTVTTPNIAWTVPIYNTYVRVSHPVVYTRTYHYDVHRYGWTPPPAPVPTVHPYYYRKPTDALPVMTARYTPGKERPQPVKPASNASQQNNKRPAPTSTARVNTTGSNANGMQSGTSIQTSNATRPSGVSSSTSTQKSETKPASSTRPSSSTTTGTRPSSTTSSTTTTRPSSTTTTITGSRPSGASVGGTRNNTTSNTNTRSSLSSSNTSSSSNNTVKTSSTTRPSVSSSTNNTVRSSSATKTNASTLSGTSSSRPSIQKSNTTSSSSRSNTVRSTTSPKNNTVKPSSSSARPSAKTRQ